MASIKKKVIQVLISVLPSGDAIVTWTISTSMLPSGGATVT
jgi:hypothetical protein